MNSFPLQSSDLLPTLKDRIAAARRRLPLPPLPHAPPLPFSHQKPKQNEEFPRERRSDKQQYIAIRNKKRKLNAKRVLLTRTGGRERKSAISLIPGERTLNVISLNPDSLAREFTQDCTYKMQRKGIHIALIQETKLKKIRITEPLMDTEF